MAAPGAVELLHAQLEHTHVNTRWVLDGLTNDEYLWEPTDLCWSIRRRTDGRPGWGRGAWICEEQWPPPERVPVPTAAWRIVHLAAWMDVYADWTFGGASARLDEYEVPPDAEGGVRWLRAAQARFSEAVAELGDAEAFVLRPVHWGEQLPIAHIVTSMINEQVHHVAEVGVLRDLRRGRARRQAVPEPAGPSWWAPHSSSTTGRVTDG